MKVRRSRGDAPCDIGGMVNYGAVFSMSPYMRLRDIYRCIQIVPAI